MSARACIFELGSAALCQHRPGYPVTHEETHYFRLFMPGTPGGTPHRMYRLGSTSTRKLYLSTVNRVVWTASSVLVDWLSPKNWLLPSR